MTVNVKTMSRKELVKLRSSIDEQLCALEVQEKKEAMEAAEKAAQKFGFSLAELTSGRSKNGKAKRPAPAKFANPASPDQTWSGRGRQPQWYKEALLGGKSSEDLLIG